MHNSTSLLEELWADFRRSCVQCKAIHKRTGSRAADRCLSRRDAMWWKGGIVRVRIIYWIKQAEENNSTRNKIQSHEDILIRSFYRAV